MYATLPISSSFPENGVAKKKSPAERFSPHGSSVRIYKTTHGALGRVAEWYRLTRRELIDVLIFDRLEKLNQRTYPQLDAVFDRRTKAVERPQLEKVVNDLFGLKLKEPEGGGAGMDDLATSMRVTANTHRIVAMLADWYERFIPWVYDALMMDRLQTMHYRMADEYAHRKPASDFVVAFRETFGFDPPAVQPDKADKPARGRRTRKKEGK